MYLWLLLSSKINDVLKVDNDPMHTSELLGAVILGGRGGQIFLLISSKRKYFIRAINKNKMGPLTGFYDSTLSPTVGMP